MAHMPVEPRYRKLRLTLTTVDGCSQPDRISCCTRRHILEYLPGGSNQQPSDIERLILHPAQSLF